MITQSTMPRCEHGYYAKDGKFSWGCPTCNPKEVNSHPLLKTKNTPEPAGNTSQRDCATYMEVGQGLRIAAGFRAMNASDR